MTTYLSTVTDFRAAAAAVSETPAQRQFYVSFYMSHDMHAVRSAYLVCLEGRLMYITFLQTIVQCNDSLSSLDSCPQCSTPVSQSLIRAC